MDPDVMQMLWEKSAGVRKLCNPPGTVGLKIHKELCTLHSGNINHDPRHESCSPRNSLCAK